MILPGSDIRNPLRPVVARRRRFASLRSVLALMLREMATTYGRSPGGYIWAVLEPVASIGLLTVVFSFAFRQPPIGSNFPMFYATGMVPFLMFNNISGKVAQSLRFSKPLLAYPSVTFVDAIIGRFVLNALTELLVAYVVLTGIYLIYETRTIPYLPGIGLAFAMALALGLGVGILNCFLMMMFPAWQVIWSILTRPLLIISCIFFVFNNVPQPFRDYLWFNPLVHIVGQIRGSFYTGYNADYVSVTYVIALSLALSAAGLVLLTRHHRNLLDM